MSEFRDQCHVVARPAVGGAQNWADDWRECSDCFTLVMGPVIAISVASRSTALKSCNSSKGTILLAPTDLLFSGTKIRKSAARCPTFLSLDSSYKVILLRFYGRCSCM